MPIDSATTLVGNLTADPELRFTQSGAAVAGFTVAVTPRFLNKQTNQWEDGEALFMRCNCWRQMAENVAESLKRGDRVIVVGRLKQRSFETREGEKRTVFELELDAVGPDLKFKQAAVREAQRQSAQQPQQQRPQQSPPDDPWATPAPARGQQQGLDQDDPWSSAPRQPAATGGYDQPPPF